MLLIDVSFDIAGQHSPVESSNYVYLRIDPIRESYPSKVGDIHYRRVYYLTDDLLGAGFHIDLILLLLPYRYLLSLSERKLIYPFIIVNGFGLKSVCIRLRYCKDAKDIETCLHGVRLRKVFRKDFSFQLCLFIHPNSLKLSIFGKLDSLLHHGVASIDDDYRINGLGNCLNIWRNIVF